MIREVLKNERGKLYFFYFLPTNSHAEVINGTISEND